MSFTLKTIFKDSLKLVPKQKIDKTNLHCTQQSFSEIVKKFTQLPQNYAVYNNAIKSTQNAIPVKTKSCWRSNKNGQSKSLKISCSHLFWNYVIFSSIFFFLRWIIKTLRFKCSWNIQSKKYFSSINDFLMFYITRTRIH